MTDLNPYGEQKRGFKFYHNLVLNFIIHSNNSLDKEINKFIDLCNKTQEFNKNEQIDYSLNNFKNFLKFIINSYKHAKQNNDEKCISFYFNLFFNFMNRIKTIYKNNLINNDNSKLLSIDKSNVLLSFFIKKICYVNNRLLYVNQINYLLNNKYIEWDENDRNETKKWLHDKLNKLPENIKNKLTETFSKNRDKVLNFKLDKSSNVIEQLEEFYYLCENTQKLNKENGDLSLNKDFYVIINLIVDGFNYGIIYENNSIINFYYNMIFNFIKRIQYLYSLTKTIKDINIDENNVKFSYLIDKSCKYIYINDNIEKIGYRYEKPVRYFIEECKDIKGWSDEDKQKTLEWLKNHYN